MAGWKAYIDTVEQNQGPVDAIGVNVRFEHADTGRKIVRSYKVASYGATVDNLKGIVKDALEKLEAFDSSAEELKLMAGQEIVG